eukprot:UN00006
MSAIENNNVPVVPPVAEPAPSGPIGPDGKPLRICCSCPETKVKRDECVLFKGEDNCKTEIDLHKQCLIALGFKL